MNISFLGVLLGLLLLLVPVCVIRCYRLPELPALLRAGGLMVAGLSVCALCLHWAIGSDSVVAALVPLVLMSAAASVLAVRKARVPLRRFGGPLFVAMTVTTVVMTLFLLGLVLGVPKPFAPRLFVPVCALLIGAEALAAMRALAAYGQGLLHHHQLYDYLLGNGATHREAEDWFVRRAMERALLPGIARMAALAVPLSAGVMWALVVAGFSALEAAVFEAMVVVAMPAAALVSLWLALRFSQRRVFDDFGRVRSALQKMARPRPADAVAGEAGRQDADAGAATGSVQNDTNEEIVAEYEKTE